MFILLHMGACNCLIINIHMQSNYRHIFHQMNKSEENIIIRKPGARLHWRKEAEHPLVAIVCPTVSPCLHKWLLVPLAILNILQQLLRQGVIIMRTHTHTPLSNVCVSRWFSKLLHMQTVYCTSQNTYTAFLHPVPCYIRFPFSSLVTYGGSNTLPWVYWKGELLWFSEAQGTSI